MKRLKKLSATCSICYIFDFVKWVFEIIFTFSKVTFFEKKQDF